MFDSMPKLLERSGTSDTGSITGFYTILVDADDMDEPVSDTVRGILDGHITLSRRLAQAYHYPAIDVLQSVSRLAPTVSGPTVTRVSGAIRRTMAVYAEAEDMINVGAYRAGSNPAIDESIAKHQAIEEFLIQEVTDRASLDDTYSAMENISGIPIPRDESVPQQAESSGNKSRAKIPVSGREAGGAAGESAPGDWQRNSVASLFVGQSISEGVSEL
jgi:flagellum-specific ATP synthase